MERTRKMVWILTALFGALLTVSGITEAMAGVEVNVNIGAPPVLVTPAPPPVVVAPASPPVLMMPAPPPVVVIPGTYVYAVPDVEVNILFYHDYWYRPYEGRWYRARSYNGPWAYLAPSRVPRALIELPPDHHMIPPGYRHIPYGQMKKNWPKWERERYWASDKDWREGWHGKSEGRGNGARDKGHDEHEGKGHKGDGGKGH